MLKEIIFTNKDHYLSKDVELTNDGYDHPIELSVTLDTSLKWFYSIFKEGYWYHKILFY